MPFAVVRRFNREGWAIDEIEVKCGNCGTAFRTELAAVGPSYMRLGAPRGAYDESDLQRWQLQTQIELEYYETYECDGCRARQQIDAARERRKQELQKDIEYYEQLVALNAGHGRDTSSDQLKLAALRSQLARETRARDT